jgi:hypothetical protein
MFAPSPDVHPAEGKREKEKKRGGIVFSVK